MSTPGKRIASAFGGVIAFATGGYFVFNTVRQGNTHKYSQLQVVELDGPRPTEEIFDSNASWYDSKIDTAETVMGLKLLRRYMIGKAKGNVLEVGGGTARNMKYYSPTTVQSVTLVDFSQEMLVRAHDKAVELGKKRKDIIALPVDAPLSLSTHAITNDSMTASDEAATTPTDGKLTICTRKMDVHKLDFPDNHFDTVIDTFGLCSFDDPVTVMHEMQRVCKPTGKLLLLEHGRSEKWKFVSDLLDNGAVQHHQNWGCWWNRNIIELAVRAGLPLNSLKSFHFGTTSLIMCPPTRIDRSSKLHLLKANTIPSTAAPPSLRLKKSLQANPLSHQATSPTTPAAAAQSGSDV